MTNPTSNFGWQMPTPTDLVTDLPADFEVFGQAVDTDFVDLLGGTTGQILSKTSNTDLDFTWITNDVGDITAVNVTSPITGGGSSGAVTIGVDAASTAAAGVVQLSDSTSTTSSVLASTPTATKSAYDLASAAIAKSTVTTAGDIIYRDATVPTRLGIGTAGQVLTVNSGATAPEWKTPSIKVVQIVNTQTGTAATGTTVMPNDGTIPQNTEGTQFMTLSITPTNSSNKLFIQIVTRQQVTGGNKDMIIALFQDSTAGALAANNYRQTGDTVAQLGVLNYYMTAGTTSSTEFKVRIGSADAGTVTFCPNNMGQIASSTITITEIAA
jgi:hypothetical protein